ncbi:GEVED domain-containing protein [Sedimentisphaera salicampi]|uniref:GEVED domain-containing protein n=1 Tax=Sedimentisphaera salicampi TaxID=1941349 RepID=UPI000B9C0551|nr:GEVED domain-containing protein [Sedimentisphaera salicampi]OXU15087.1 hypothetical protein SMSP1_01282 [Sedimentisphaera salicampi]
MKKLLFSSILILLIPGIICAEPYFSKQGAADWQEALDAGFIRGLTPSEWDGYMNQWQQFLGPGGVPYPVDTQFLPPELYVAENAGDMDEQPGLVMAWGEDGQSDGDYASAWVYEYGVDPDLSGAVIQITVVPPQYGPTGSQVNTVSFGIRDMNGAIRSWHWVCGPGGIPWNTPTTITINAWMTGIGATTPSASGFMNNPAFDITKVIDFIVDENAAWVGGAAPVPPPGQSVPKPWNYWYDLIVRPSDNPEGMTVGFNPEIHQDIENPDLWPNDYHMEFVVESYNPFNPDVPAPPILLSHIDDMFMSFDYSITPLGDGYYQVEMDWSNPVEDPIPYCTVIHLGFELEVINSNVILEVKGWWTKDGEPVGDIAEPNLPNDGFTPLLGFRVEDGMINPPPIGMPEFGYLTLRNGDGNPDTSQGEIPVEIVQLELAVLSPEELANQLGDYPFGELNSSSPLQQELPWQPALIDGALVGENNPVNMPPDSFFDVFFDIDLPEPTPIDAGDFVIIREKVRFTNNNNMVEERWSWHMHEADNGECDLGDAPDDTNAAFAPMTTYPAAVAAKFPTTYQNGSPPFGPIHFWPASGPYLGTGVTLEWDADFGSDEDPTNNIIPVSNTADKDFADDGIIGMPLSMPKCENTAFDYRVTVPSAAAGLSVYVNAWADFNRDGDWDDVIVCQDSGQQVSEWIVQDQPLANLSAGVQTFTTPPFYSWHPGSADEEPMWLRITISPLPFTGSGDPVAAGSGPPGGYTYGETEDYLFVPVTTEGDTCDCADLTGDGFVDLSDLACMASQWLTSCP